MISARLTYDLGEVDLCRRALFSYRYKPSYWMRMGWACPQRIDYSRRPSSPRRLLTSQPCEPISQLITNYSLLITHYSLLITHYSLLITSAS